MSRPLGEVRGRRFAACLVVVGNFLTPWLAGVALLDIPFFLAISIALNVVLVASTTVDVSPHQRTSVPGKVVMPVSAGGTERGRRLQRWRARHRIANAVGGARLWGLFPGSIG
jgi:hypothetical protein